jgi:hypothetical protein
LGLVLLLYAGGSLFHHVRNAEFLGEYPSMPAWLSPALVYGAWLGVTAIGLIGYVPIRCRYPLAGLCLLAIYGAAGLYGLAHYTLAPLSAHTLMMNANIWLEAGAAVALLTMVAVSIARHNLDLMGNAR